MKDPTLQLYSADLSTKLSLPFALSPVVGGFPSPAEGYLQGSIDLNRKLINHPATTFFAKVIGHSMRDRGIEEGDLVVIDKSLEPREGDIVVAFIDGEFTIKTIHIEPEGKGVTLLPANPDFQPIPISPEEDFIVWGVVTYTIKKQR
ncbi:MAG: translesion error-prone DNA polymerase V autoproteolytic subunit [Bacteroidaceae bacterium]|nr:translesion error-prone DNA polymerase V autoproteolytic subunit [Bacteroidaceae bacterium]